MSNSKNTDPKWTDPLDRVEPPSSKIAAFCLLHAVGARVLVIDRTQAVAIWKETNRAAVRKAIRMLYGNVEIFNMDDSRVPVHVRSTKPDFIDVEIEFIAEQWQ